MDCGVLVSKDGKHGFSKYTPNFVDNYMKYRMFGTCKDNSVANMGLIMGYVYYMKIVMNKIVYGESSDDQKNLNVACSQMPFLKVDKNCIIFENCSSMYHVARSTAFFCQTPGKLSFSRIKRMFEEYPQFLVREIVIFFIILIFILIVLNKKRKWFKRNWCFKINNENNKQFDKNYK